MEAGRAANFETKMKGCINDKHKLTDIYLPRKCDYTDRVITSKDYSSVQISICDVKDDGTIDLSKNNIVTLCGYVRFTGQSDVALEKVMKEKRIIWLHVAIMFTSSSIISQIFQFLPPTYPSIRTILAIAIIHFLLPFYKHFFIKYQWTTRKPLPTRNKKSPRTTNITRSTQISTILKTTTTRSPKK